MRSLAYREPVSRKRTKPRQNMNLQSTIINEKNPPITWSIESFFESWKDAYDAYCHLKGTGGQHNRRNDDVFEKQAYRDLAINSFLLCVNCVVSHEEQTIRIQALFFLVKLYHDDNISEKKEGYFYQAVELIRHYYGDDFQDTSHWRHAISTYLESINPDFTQKFPQKYIPLLTPLLTLSIQNESKRRIEERLENAAKIIQTESYPDSHLDMIGWLEEIFGPMRILIVSEASNEEIFSHRWEKEESGKNSKKEAHFYHTTLDIFDKKARYKISVDRWDTGKTSKFKWSHLKNIIYPAIGICIKKIEDAYFDIAWDHSGVIRWYEDGAEYHIQERDYGHFIERVLWEYTVEPSKKMITACQQSVDICRMITLEHAGNNEFSWGKLPQKMDEVLWWVIQRSVLSLVQSHLMTRQETMHGTGYPFGLSKSKIPIESRIYVIIRSYEALYSAYSNHPQKIIETLKDWGNWGYFDRDALSIFLEILEDTYNPLAILPKKTYPDVSLNRSSRYKEYIHRWKNIIDQIQWIEKDYDSLRWASGQNDELKNIIAKSMNEWTLELRRMAEIKTVFIVTRHGEAVSDTPWGPPGSDDEHITEAWWLSSLLKGDLLQGIKAHILTSPLLRAIESARLICQRINDCISNPCVPCSRIQEEGSFRNPAKNKDNGRYNSYAQKLFEDNNGLMEFLIDSVSSSEQSSNICITHRDSWRHLIFWLTNLFSQEKAIGEKTIIENSTMLVYLFQWDRCIPWDLWFPVFGWKDVLSSVNTISTNIFWQPFYERGNWKVDIIALHDRFLDFIDFHREHSPEKITEFRKKLEENDITKHLGEIIGL